MDSFETAHTLHGGVMLQEYCHANFWKTLTGRDFIATHNYPTAKPFPIHDGEIGAIVKLGKNGEINEVIRRVCIHAGNRHSTR